MSKMLLELEFDFDFDNSTITEDEWEEFKKGTFYSCSTFLFGNYHFYPSFRDGKLSDITVFSGDPRHAELLKNDLLVFQKFLNSGNVKFNSRAVVSSDESGSLSLTRYKVSHDEFDEESQLVMFGLTR